MRFKEILLITCFAFLLLEVPLGFNVNLAPGVSLKNLFIYILVAVTVIESTIGQTDVRFSLMRLHVAYISLILFIVFSWAISAAAFERIDYPVGKSFIELKSSYVDRYLIMFVFLYALKDRQQVINVALALIWIVLLTNFLTLLDLFNIPNLPFIEVRHDGRVEGLIGQANQYGGFLVFWIPAFVSAFLLSHGPRRVAIGIGVLVSIGLLLLTGSRGAMVGALAGSMIGAVVLRRYLPSRVIIRGTAATVMVTTAIVLVVAVQFTEMVESRIERTTASDSSMATAGRVDIWSKALSIMADNPESFIYGNGWMTFRLIVNKGAHNMYLETLFELGAIGLLLYLLLLYVTVNLFRDALRGANGQTRILLLGVTFSFCAVIVSTFFSELYRPWMLIWAYAGLMLRLALIEISDIRISHATSRPSVGYAR